MNTKKIIEKAYELQLEEGGKDQDFLRQNRFLKEFENYILAWDGESDLKDMFTLVDDYEFIASIGQGRKYKANYMKFLTDITTKQKIKKLADIKKEYKKNPYKPGILAGKVKNIELEDHMKSFGFNGNPKIFVYRFLNCMFPEICTSIANEGDLKKVADDLGISYAKKTPNISLQFDIRYEIDKVLEDITEYDQMDIFDRMVVAWFVKEVKER